MSLRPSGAWPFTPCSTTHPVTVRVPTGTRTRAPIDGSSRCSGTRYVRRSRNGTGTATEIVGTLLIPGEDGPDAFHVLPHFSFRSGISQQVRRMIRRHQDRVPILVLAPANPRNRLRAPQQRLRREFAERHDDLRLDDVDLPEEK